MRSPGKGDLEISLSLVRGMTFKIAPTKGESLKRKEQLEESALVISCLSTSLILIPMRNPMEFNRLK